MVLIRITWDCECLWFESKIEMLMCKFCFCKNKCGQIKINMGAVPSVSSLGCSWTPAFSTFRNLCRMCGHKSRLFIIIRPSKPLCQSFWLNVSHSDIYRNINNFHLIWSSEEKTEQYLCKRNFKNTKNIWFKEERFIISYWMNVFSLSEKVYVEVLCVQGVKWGQMTVHASLDLDHLCALVCVACKSYVIMNLILFHDTYAFFCLSSFAVCLFCT